MAKLQFSFVDEDIGISSECSIVSQCFNRTGIIKTQT